MILKYGAFAFPAYGAGLVISKSSILNDAQEPVQEAHRWGIEGLLLNPGTTRASMTTAIRQLEAAFSVSGRDVILYEPDGRTKSAHQLLSRESIGGVRVISPPSWPDYRGAEYINYRTFKIELEAIFPLNSARSALRSFSESIQTSGGGPRYGYLEPLNALPQRQLLKQATIFRATQRGSAVGLYGYPTVPQAIWPGALMESPAIEQGSPKRLGDSLVDFPVSWSYSFESSGPLSGRPNVWAAR